VQHNIIQARKAAKIFGKHNSSACELAWQIWKAGVDYYHKYRLLQILCAFGAYYVLWGTPPKSGYFSAVGLSSVKMVADRHRHAA